MEYDFNEPYDEADTECIACTNHGRFLVHLECRTRDKDVAHDMATHCGRDRLLRVRTQLGSYWKNTEARISTPVHWFVPVALSEARTEAVMESQKVRVCGKHLVAVVGALQRLARSIEKDIQGSGPNGWRHDDLEFAIWALTGEDLEVTTAMGTLNWRVCVEEVTQNPTKGGDNSGYES